MKTETKYLYQVANNLYSLVPKAIEYTKKTDSFYWNNINGRNALETTWYKTFENKDEAISYIESLLKQNIENAKRTLSYSESKLNEFYELIAVVEIKEQMKSKINDNLK